MLKIDKGQLSRWENESPRLTLDNLGRALAGYGASLRDLVAAMEDSLALRTSVEDPDPTVKEQLRSLTEAVRQLEERQAEIESRMERLERAQG